MRCALRRAAAGGLRVRGDRQRGRRLCAQAGVEGARVAARRPRACAATRVSAHASDAAAARWMWPPGWRLLLAARPQARRSLGCVCARARACARAVDGVGRRPRRGADGRGRAADRGGPAADGAAERRRLRGAARLRSACACCARRWRRILACTWRHADVRASCDARVPQVGAAGRKACANCTCGRAENQGKVVVADAGADAAAAMPASACGSVRPLLRAHTRLCRFDRADWRCAPACRRSATWAMRSAAPPARTWASRRSSPARRWCLQSAAPTSRLNGLYQTNSGDDATRCRHPASAYAVRAAGAAVTTHTSAAATLALAAKPASPVPGCVPLAFDAPRTAACRGAARAMQSRMQLARAAAPARAGCVAAASARCSLPSQQPCRLRRRPGRASRHCGAFSCG